MYQESELLEFKRKVNDSVIKEIIAFCNTKGGTIIIGYDDDGSVCGVENVKEEFDKISNKIHDSIEPEISFLISQRIEKEDGKDIIIIEVLKGTNRPYYIKSKGMTPEGVYIRLGATSTQATRDSIREMIIESSGITFEKNISVNQDLTFNYAQKLFKDRQIAFGKREQKNLGIINDKDLYTNLGLLISDQCPYTIKMAVYADDDKTEFLDKKETNEGCILEQLKEAESYLRLNNKVAAKIVGLYRVDTYDYPQEVIREALLNCIGHRDYEIPGSTLIHVLKDKIEFLSLGGLVKGLTIEDIKLGSSSSRNPNLVNILHRLGLVEAYGSGIPRMLAMYKCANRLPSIEVAPHSFLVTIPKIDVRNDYGNVIDYLRENDFATRYDIENRLGLKKGKTIEILNELVDRDVIEKQGNAKNIKYKLK